MRMKSSQVVGFLLIIFLVLFITYPQIEKPYLGDEFYFIQEALSIKSTGSPAFQITYQGLWLKGSHPPFLSALISLSLFIISENMVRIVPVSLVLLTGIMIFFITRKLNYTRNKYLPLVAMFIYLINPFTIQSSLLLDIETSLAPFILSLFVYAFLHCYKKLDIKNDNLRAFDVLSGCAGSLEGMIIGYELIKNKLAKKVGIVGVELMSKVCDDSDIDSMIYADGAGIVQLSAVDANERFGICSYSHQTDSELAHLINLGKSYNPKNTPQIHLIHG